MTDWKIYQGDCLELMSQIPNGSVDMVLCDLPYGITENLWDKLIPFEPLWAHYKRVCKRNAAVVLFSQMPFTVDLVNSNRYEFRYEWIYQKTRCAGFLNTKRMPMKVHENILIFYKILPTYNPQYFYRKPYFRGMSSALSANYNKVERKTPPESLDGRRYPLDVIKFNNSNLHGHPTAKPVELCEYLIRTYTNEGETVLDNCMGSGSTGVACINTNRKFVGIELVPEYFEIAQKRIEAATEEMRWRLPFGDSTPQASSEEDIPF